MNVVFVIQQHLSIVWSTLSTLLFPLLLENSSTNGLLSRWKGKETPKFRDIIADYCFGSRSTIGSGKFKVTVLKAKVNLTRVFWQVEGGIFRRWHYQIFMYSGLKWVSVRMTSKIYEIKVHPILDFWNVVFKKGRKYLKRKRIKIFFKGLNLQNINS